MDMRILKLAFVGIGSVLIVLLGAPLLFWLGRTATSDPGELVVDEGIDDDTEVDVEEFS